MLGFLEKLLGRPSRRPARTLALYGPHNDNLDLLAGLDWVLKWAAKLGLPEAEWVTWNYGGPGNRQYKSYKLGAWTKRGRPLPDPACTSVEIGRFLEGSEGGLTDYIWTAGLSNDVSFTLCIDRNKHSLPQSAEEGLLLGLQEISLFEYGYSLNMEMEKGPVIYVNGGTLNGRKFFTQPQLEEIAKWCHAIGECGKLGLPLSNYLRDIYPLNFINPHHLAMQVKGQSLKDWIEADPKRGSLKPLIEDKLWVWQVLENRIQPIRRVLGKERLLISWSDFNTPSGGPLGHTYGAKPGKKTMNPFNGLPLTEDEQRWVAEGLDMIKPIFGHYTAQKPKDFAHLIGRREPLFAKLLDIAFTAWSEDQRPDKATPEIVLQAFAAALGEHLVKHFGMAWYAVEDEYGRSLGVAHRGKDGAQTWSYPVDSVAKRIERGETGFIPGVVEAVGNEIKHG